MSSPSVLCTASPDTCPSAFITTCRQRAVPLVFRRLQQLTDSPTLNATARVKFGGAQCLPRLRSFSKWLGRHRGSVRELRLWLDAHALDADSKGEAAATLAALLAACGTAANLSRLQLVFSPLRFPCTGWLTELHSLRTLALHRGVHDIEGCLAALGCLDDLQLADPDESLRLGPSAHLPTSLTRVHLDGLTGTLPQQASIGNLANPPSVDSAVPLRLVPAGCQAAKCFHPNAPPTPSL